MGGKRGERIDNEPKKGRAIGRREKIDQASFVWFSFDPASPFHYSSLMCSTQEVVCLGPGIRLLGFYPSPVTYYCVTLGKLLSLNFISLISKCLKY